MVVLIDPEEARRRAFVGSARGRSKVGAVPKS